MNTTTYAADLIQALGDRGIAAEVARVGGNCHAVGAGFPGADLLVTDGDAGLPEYDDETGSLWVGLYADDERRWSLWLPNNPTPEQVADVAVYLLHGHPLTAERVDVAAIARRDRVVAIQED